MKKDLGKIEDLAPPDVANILSEAFSFKRKSAEGIRAEPILNGKVVAMIFEKPSLRTKVAFEVAAHYLGGQAVFLSSEQILSSGKSAKGRESVKDIARNLERFCDLILARVYDHKVIDEIANCIKKPVINALSDLHHPTQALADLMAIQWHKGKTQGIKVAYVGDGNNVATSLMQICAMTGIHFAIAAPEGYEISKEACHFATQCTRYSKSTLQFLVDPNEAVLGADVVYTDTFVSMGDEAEAEERARAFKHYQVNAALLKKAKPDALFMHDLPAYRGEEVTEEVFEGPQSIVFDQAECRLHIAKALLSLYL